MATYVNDLRLKEIATGDESGTWGTSTNTNLELIAEAFSFGTEAITTNADTHTTTIADGSTDPGRSLYLKYTGTLDSACTITIGPNTISKLWFIENGTSGSQNIIISQGSGANITIPPGDTKAIYSDGAGSGAAMVDVFASLNVVDLKVQDDLTVTDDVAIGGLATVGGTLSVTGIVTLTDDLIIGDGKTIGSASDVDAMTIAANGQVTFTQTLIGTALDISGDIDVDGTTNLDIVDIDGAVDMATTLAVAGNVDFNGDLDVDGTTNLDVVDIDGAVDMASTLNVSGAITGTLGTAAQPNITSVGTLSSLGVGSTLTINNTASSSFGTIEISGTSGSFIDLKSPSSDDFDLRIITDGTGGVIDSGSGEVTIKRQSSTKLVTTSTGIDVTGIVAATELNIAEFLTSTNVFESNVSGQKGARLRAAVSDAGTPTFSFHDDTNTGMYSSGADTLNFSTAGAESMRIDSSGNVGIGETSPDNLLHVKGSADTLVKVESTDTIVRLDLTDSSGTSRVQNTGGKLVLQADPSNAVSNTYLGFEVDSTERMRISSAGNVGIGTASPNFKLHLKDGTSTAIYQQFSNDTTGNTSSDGTVLGIDADGDFLINNQESKTIKLFTADTERMRIDTSGHLLVGSSNASNAVAGFRAYSGGNGAFTVAGQPLELNRLSSDGSILGFQKDGTTVGSIGAVGGDLAIYSTSSSHAGLRFLVNGILPTNNAGTINNNTVDLGGASNAFKDLYLSGKSQADTYEFAQNSSASNATDAIYRATTNTIAIKTNSSERMRIDSSGNVGIGTASPEGTLHVENASNNALIMDAPANRYNAIGFQTAGTDKWWLGRADSDQIASDAFFIGTDAGNATDPGGLTSKLVINTSGNVGIGNASPSNKLDVTGAIGSTGTISSTSVLNCNGSGSADAHINVGIGRNANGFSYIDLIGDTTYSDYGARIIRNNGGANTSTVFHHRGTGELSFRTDDAAAMKFETDATERMRIDSSGIVLVGTTDTTPFNNTSGVGVAINPGEIQVASTANCLALNHSDGDGDVARFFRSGQQVGGISVDSSSTTYATSSDARLKDVTGSARGLEVINKLNPVAYNWKADGKADEGLIAQEVKELVPNAVSGSEEDMYSMDYSKLVVHLVAGMKEQQELITTLQAEVALLKEK